MTDLTGWLRQEEVRCGDDMGRDDFLKVDEDVNEMTLTRTFPVTSSGLVSDLFKAFS